LELEEKRTNFSETLKKWGLTSGPYVVIPGFGPATFRNAVGFLCDSFLDPLFLLTLDKSLPGNQHHELLLADTGVQLTALIAARAKVAPIYEDIENNSVDRYSKLRGIVLQQSVNQ
jgi:phospholipid-binding lipoprotein MlaA